MQDLDSRMRELIGKKLKPYGRFQELARLSYIKDATWKHWWAGRQRANADMVQAVARAWPANAFWLVTGDELPQIGFRGPGEPASTSARNLEIAAEQFLTYRQRLRNEVSATQARSVLEGDDPTDESAKAVAEAFVNQAISGSRVMWQKKAETVGESLTEAYEFAVQHDEFLPELEKLWEQQVLKHLQKQHGDKPK